MASPAGDFVPAVHARRTLQQILASSQILLQLNSSQLDSHSAESPRCVVFSAALTVSMDHSYLASARACVHKLATGFPCLRLAGPPHPRG
eukprot:988892-Rhodomonas_salina.6